MAVRGTNSLYFKPEIDNSGLQQGLNQGLGMISSFAGSIGRINPFAALVAGAVSATAIISKEAYQMAKSFESAMAEVKTIANVGEAEFQDLQRSVFGLYQQLGTEPPDKLAKGLYEIIGAGFEAADALELLEIASKAATAGVTTTEVAADGLTTILNAFQLSTKDAAEVADIMFATVDRGKISFEELSSQIAQVAPLAASSGISFAEIGAAISTLTKQGIPASQAMTQIRSAIISTNEVMGDGVFEAHTLQEAFQAMYDMAGGSQNELKNLAGRIEAVNAFLAIAGPNIEGATEDLNAMADAAGSVNKNFKIVTSTAANQWDIFFSRIKSSTIGIGNTLLEMSGGIAEFLNNAISDANDLSAALDQEVEKVNELFNEYVNANTAAERRSEILEDLKQINPAIVSGINNEADAYLLLTDRVKNYNKEIAFRKAFEDDYNNIASLQEDAADLEATKIRIESDLRKSLTEFQRDFLDPNFLESTAYSTLLDHERKRIEDALFGSLDDLEKIKEVNRIIEEVVSDQERAFQQRQRGGGANVFPTIGGFTRTELFRTEKELNEVSDQILKIQDKVNSELQSYYDNSENAYIIVAQINEVRTKEELKKFESYNNIAIKEAIKARELVLGAFEDIKNITKEDYKENPNALSEYLKSENEQIRKAAEDRRKLLEFIPTGNTGDGDPVVNRPKDLKALGLPSEGVDLDINFVANTDSIRFIETHIKQLKEKFELASAEDRPQIQRWIDFHQKRLEEARKGTEKEKDLYQDVHRSIESMSVSALEGYIEYWKGRLSEAEKGSKLETEILSKIGDAQAKITEQKIKQGIKLMSEASRLFRDFGSDALADAIDDLGEVGAALADSIGVINNSESTGLEKVTSIVSLFVVAYEKLQKLTDWLNRDKALERQVKANQALLDQIKMESEINDIHRERVQLIRDASVLLDNYYQRDYSDAMQRQIDAEKKYQASITALREGAQIQGIGESSGFIGIGKRDRKFELSLNKVIEWLNGEGSAVPFGHNDVAKNNAFIELTHIVSDSLDALGLKSEDVTKFTEQNWMDLFRVLNEMGRVTEKTTRELLEQATEAAEEYNAALEDMRSIIKDIAGSLGGSLKDSLVDAFEQGTSAAKAMGATVSEVLQNVVEQMAFNSIFGGEFDKLQERMEKSLGVGGDGSFIDDFGAFFSSAKNLTNDFNQALQDAKDIAENSGLNLFNPGSGQAQGLSGAISTITEDTANAMTGILNGIRLDVASGIGIAQQSSEYLSRIAQNTEYNRYLERLESIDNRMGSIESGLLNIQTQG